MRTCVLTDGTLNLINEANIKPYNEVSKLLYENYKRNVLGVGLEDKQLLIVAGPNGSGKSSLSVNLLGHELFPKFYITPDELVKNVEYSIIENEYVRYSTAMSVCEEIRRETVVRGSSLAFETVLSTPEKLDFLKFASENGYKISSLFVATNSPEVNIDRVSKRVEQGGHDVPVDKIRQRYYRSLSNLAVLFLLSDSMIVVDNSVKPQVILIKDGVRAVKLFGNKDWLESYLIEPLQECGFRFDTISDEEESKKFVEKYHHSKREDMMRFW